ncbi:thioester reductase domain-containing protein [Nocardia jejuensis]|uniref:thioester reductase domain-containing protein n=1 Tax=Nocardia jejuensis TaxID=328049 RepID=UPI000830CA22|nr:thioester reductase domain-containing protein [Nocardia jejuensis]
MTGPAEPASVRNPAVDRRTRAESLERGATLDVAALLARTNTPAPPRPPDAQREHRPGSSLVSDSAAVLIDAQHAPRSHAPADTHPSGAHAAPNTTDRRGPRTWDADELASAITELANRFTASPIDADTDFFDAGGTSIAAVELVAALSSELGIHPDLDTVFFDARPRRLARRWLADNPRSRRPQHDTPTDPESRALGRVHPERQPRTTVSPAASDAGPRALDANSGPDPRVARTPAGLPGTGTRTPTLPESTHSHHAVAVRAETDQGPDTGMDDDLAQLFADLGGADRLPVVDAPRPVAPQRILLTGATGFLGSHLLLDLLRHSQAHVVCLVRAQDDQAATHRLEQALRRFALPWSREVLRRVTPLAGDLREPRLGLSDERWDALAGEIDSIVNAGAAVDFLRGYPSLRRTNVLGPLTLAELACTGRPKPVHHISSLAVFNGSDADVLAEDEPTANVSRLPIGYDRSKWAAEAVLRRAAEHGLVVTVLRPGGIGSHPETGAHNPQDLSAGITAALMRFRTVPGFRYLNAAPVDWVSRIAAEIVGTPDAWGHTYHLTGTPTSLEQMVAETTVGGLGVRVQHWEQWCEDTVRAIRDTPVPELESLAQVLQSPAARRQLAAMVTASPSSATRTEAFVAAHGLPAPLVNGPAARGALLAAMASTTPPDAEPYLRFNETLSGTLSPIDETVRFPGPAGETVRIPGPIGETRDFPCDLRLTLSVASSAQVFVARTLDVSGELRCPGLHDDPLVVEGTAVVRPHDGIPLRHEVRHPIMHYRLTLRDSSGDSWWLEGYKFAAAQRRLVRQLGTQVIEIGRAGEPAAYTGEVSVPMHTYLPDQIDGIQIDPRLPERQQRLAKLLWLSWFGGQLGKSVLEPMLRVGTDLLDLRRALRKENRR